MSSGYSQVLKEVNEDETVYYTRGFELISRRTGSEASYYLFDGGMSVRGITDEDGILTDTLVFDAFGNEAERTGTTENSYGFQGEEQDSTGLYYLRARYMDPATGTFTSMDTYGGNLEDPMSLHKYLFANSNPVKWCDPSGHSSQLELGVTMCIISGLLSSMTYQILAEYNEVETDKSYWGGLVGLFIIGAVIGFFGGFYFTGLFVAVINVIFYRVLCYLVLLIGGLKSCELASNAYDSGNELVGDIFNTLGIAAIFSFFEGLISGFRNNTLNRNKRGCVDLSGGESADSGTNIIISENKRSHVLNGHTVWRYAIQTQHVDESAVENYLNENTFFSPEWNEQTVISASEYAYNEAISNGVRGNYTTQYEGENVTVYVKPNGTFSTAYGDYSFTYEDFMNLFN